MVEKRNVTVCFNPDEMYIYDFFKSKGKASTEMKRVLKEYVENNDAKNDSSEVVDERVAKILSTIFTGGSITISNTNNRQDIVEPSYNEVEDSKQSSNDDAKDGGNEAEIDSFDLPPDDIISTFDDFGDFGYDD